MLLFSLVSFFEPVSQALKWNKWYVSRIFRVNAKGMYDFGKKKSVPKLNQEWYIQFKCLEVRTSKGITEYVFQSQKFSEK